jgi:hypothetical protein
MTIARKMNPESVYHPFMVTKNGGPINWLGDKTGQGFFMKKEKVKRGEKEICTLDLKSL